MLKAIVEEPSLSVKKHILQLIAVLAKHELMRGTWNELFTFIDAFVKSNDANERKVSFQTTVHYSVKLTILLKLIL